MYTGGLTELCLLAIKQTYKSARHGLNNYSSIIILTWTDWLIDWLIDCFEFYAVSAIFQTCNGADYKNCKSACITNREKRSCIVWTLPKSKFRVGNVSEHFRKMCCIVNWQSQNMHSGCCSPCERYEWVIFECAICIFELITIIKW